MDITIQQIEAAITFYCTQQPANGQNKALCPSAKRLADLYGRMIFRNESSIDLLALPEDQQKLLSAALHLSIDT